MAKPVPVVILSILAMLNGGVTCVLGVSTLLGSRLLFTPAGYGTDRIAISQVFGPLANQTGWIVLVLGVCFVLVGYGLYNLREWARLTVCVVLAVVAALTFVVVVWGVYRGQFGVVASGLLKIVFEAGISWYLATASVRRAFARKS
ncbi:MAG TPA: hypothetical protein VEY11_07725 [Pyrinomonadaceae bacterium]|nr:hypothetical protein [Pyrinomonadaceae bacterium]